MLLYYSSCTKSSAAVLWLKETWVLTQEVSPGKHLHQHHSSLALTVHVYMEKGFEPAMRLFCVTVLSHSFAETLVETVCASMNFL